MKEQEEFLPPEQQGSDKTVRVLHKEDQSGMATNSQLDYLYTNKKSLPDQCWNRQI
jgi:hypothetical protein